MRPAISPAAPASRPPIRLRRSDAAKLFELALDGLLRSPRSAGALLQEVRRASVLADQEIGPETVVLGSAVAFRDAAGRVRRFVLVTPDEADPAKGRLSVLSSLGAALIGLSLGQAIDWPDRVGGTLRLVIVAVEPPSTSPNAGEGEPRRAPTDGAPAPDAGDIVPFRRPAPAAPPSRDDPPPPSAA
jgi:regulator of nucleoside diphosphate kinase